MKVTFFRRSKLFRLVSLGSIYTILLFICLWLSYQLRFDFAPPAGEMASYWKVGVWVVALKLLLLWFFRQFEGILRYFSVPDMKRVLYSMGSASAVMLLVWTQGGMESTPPRGVILIDFILSCGAVGGVRMALRIFLESYFAPPVKGSRRAKRVGIFGAGDVGASLAMELMKRRGFGLVPVAFFDDDPDKWYSRVHDIPVVGAPESLRNNHLNLELDEVVIAMPSAPAKRIGELVSLLQRSKLKCATVPSMDQLATGQVKVSQLRSVEIQDLLGRDPVNLEVDDIRQILIDKVVLVTGAGGSIGSELCRQIASFNPKRLLMVEQSELNLFQIEQELIELGHGGISLPLIGDILDELRMEYIFSRFMPGVVFHAAAHKHVPLMEGQPSEAIKNNTFGTKAVADLALRHGVKRFVMISTDKAINPTNVMGASKRLGEIYVQSLFAAYPDKTKFMAV
ncbi:MAG: polysaccharide biosynthesis protein, partial [Verrucomicrobia bacterium]|nr:polysaccharide biosynthesis protein [Verrucomicrobiota bacterium]